ncbi:hypothetical protein [Frigidibacter oleivorans]|uniref:hypothetical protein n=1 Tax=Frigidibacter oleivorans TaxID=2487129 RepID=UPI000F8E398C|nr:hypothetical protein [Frigidibacter oleivorans]
MLIEQLPAGAVAAAIFLAPGLHGAGRLDAMDEAIPEVAAPFSHAPSFKISVSDIQALALRQEYLEGSTALNLPVSFSMKDEGYFANQTPAELVNELRRVSGLTWAQVAEVFGVSKRTPYHWSSGETVSAENHERLGRVVAVLRFIDKGSAEENRNLLLGHTRFGQTYLELLRSGEYELVRDLAGKGAGRPSFDRVLTQEAEKLNASTHWGKAIVAADGMDETEILPLNQPKLRRAKARRGKV